MSNPVINTFNTQLINLAEALSDRFQDDGDLKLALTGIKTLKANNSNKNIDLRNVGYKTDSIQGLGYSKGNENFQLRLEKKDFTLNSIKYWKHGNKMIYLVPMKDGRTLTLYGNISLSTAMTVAKSLNL